MSSFSERYGHQKPRDVLQLRSMDERLRNRIWNVICAVSFDHFHSQFTKNTDFGKAVSHAIQSNFFGLPTDEIEIYSYEFRADIKKRYLSLAWYRVYDFVEFLAKLPFEGHTYIDNKRMYFLVADISRELETILEQEKSAYRFSGCELIPITNEIELAEIASARNQTSSTSVSSHIDAAVKLYSNREEPDYRNSIKESISAVEAAAKELAGTDVNSLGPALNALSKTDILHPALAKGFSNLYGWTSNSAGIRHAMMDKATITEADARYMLVSCSAFSNYLVSKK